MPPCLDEPLARILTRAPAGGCQPAPMNGWLMVAAVVAVTAGLSAGFWLVVMPRAAKRALSRPAAFLLLGGFGLLVLGAPVVGLLLLQERTVPLICALIFGWAAAVRGVGWVLARKYFVPRLRAQPPVGGASGEAESKDPTAPDAPRHGGA